MVREDVDLFQKIVDLVRRMPDEERRKVIETIQESAAKQLKRRKEDSEKVRESLEKLKHLKAFWKKRKGRG